jgi:hypothetical protein
MLAFLLGFVLGMVGAVVSLVCLCRAVRRRHALQPVDAGVRRGIPVEASGRLGWQDAAAQIEVLRWRPAHWMKRWPEAYVGFRFSAAANPIRHHVPCAGGCSWNLPVPLFPLWLLFWWRGELQRIVIFGSRLRRWRC